MKPKTPESGRNMPMGLNWWRPRRVNRLCHKNEYNMCISNVFGIQFHCCCCYCCCNRSSSSSKPWRSLITRAHIWSEFYRVVGLKEKRKYGRIAVYQLRNIYFINHLHRYWPATVSIHTYTHFPQLTLDDLENHAKNMKLIQHRTLDISGMLFFFLVDGLKIVTGGHHWQNENQQKSMNTPSCTVQLNI